MSDTVLNNTEPRDTMPSNTVLRVVSTASWLADDLSRQDLVPVVHDVGLWAPVDASSTSWWMPGQHAARLAASGITPLLWAPDALLLERLPASATGRRVHVHTLGGIADCSLAADGQTPVFMKAAEHKLPGLAAGVWTVEGFTAAAQQAGYPREGLILVSELIRFEAEYRVFILDGEPVAASAYLIGGLTWDAWTPNSLPPTSEATQFAHTVLAGRSLPVPRGWVLDVGTTREGSWAVVEANPAWCANPYWASEDGTDAVVATILASQGPGNRGNGTRWSPLEHWTRMARPLPRR